MNSRGADLSPQAEWLGHDDLPKAAGQRPVALATPNVSAGDDPETVEAICDAVRLPGLRLLDRHVDPDHGRTVLTVAGEPLALQDAMVALAAECLDRIDLRRHRGVHPRIGALDLIPIVALTPADMPFASELARGLVQRIGTELALPTFGYGAIASDPERTRPHDFRKEGLDWLAVEVEEGRIVPDAGPSHVHPSAGVVLVGARGPLVSWNIDLPQASQAEALALADRVRERDGGLPGVRALGLYLTLAGVAQVSMHLENFRLTSPGTAMAALRREAERLGVEVGEGELIGLIPGEALRGQSPSALGLAGFRPGQVLEAHLRTLWRRTD